MERNCQTVYAYTTWKYTRTIEVTIKKARKIMTVATKEKISKLYKKLRNNMGKSQSVIELTDGYSDGNIALEKEYVKSFGIVPENETSKCDRNIESFVHRFYDLQSSKDFTVYENLKVKRNSRLTCTVFYKNSKEFYVYQQEYIKMLPKNAEIFFDIEKLITTKFAKIIAKQDEKTVAVLMPIKVDKVTDLIDFHPNKNK